MMSAGLSLVFRGLLFQPHEIHAACRSFRRESVEECPRAYPRW